MGLSTTIRNFVRELTGERARCRDFAVDQVEATLTSCGGREVQSTEGLPSGTTVGKVSVGDREPRTFVFPDGKAAHTAKTTLAFHANGTCYRVINEIP